MTMTGASLVVVDGGVVIGVQSVWCGVYVVIGAQLMWCGVVFLGLLNG